MRYMTTSVIGTHAVGQFLCRQPAIGLDDGPFPMHPRWLNRIAPRTLAGQAAHDNADATTLSGLNLSIMLPYPRAHGLADMPRRVIPDQHQNGFVPGKQLIAAPRQKVRRDGAHGSAIHKPQQHLIWWRKRTVWCRVAHQHPIARQRYGIGVILGPPLRHQPHRCVVAVPGRHARCGKPAPPDRIRKAKRPC